MSNQLKNETSKLHKSLGFFQFDGMRCIPHMQQFPLNKMVYLQLIHSPHQLIQATNERFLPADGTFRAILASESHSLLLVLVLFVHWWPAPTGVGSVLVDFINNQRQAL
jgi:hypothetical protein